MMSVINTSFFNRIWNFRGLIQSTIISQSLHSTVSWAVFIFSKPSSKIASAGKKKFRIIWNSFMTTPESGLKRFLNYIEQIQSYCSQSNCKED